MIEIRLDQLGQYEGLVPDCDYSDLEKFLRSVPFDFLEKMVIISENLKRGPLLPIEQLTLFVTIAAIFMLEYGQEVFTRTNFIELMPMFLTSCYYEYVSRKDPQVPRTEEYRELIPSKITIYEQSRNYLLKETRLSSIQ